MCKAYASVVPKALPTMLAIAPLSHGFGSALAAVTHDYLMHLQTMLHIVFSWPWGNTVRSHAHGLTSHHMTVSTLCSNIVFQPAFGLLLQCGTTVVYML
jgi:hypothetical protein